MLFYSGCSLCLFTPVPQRRVLGHCHESHHNCSLQHRYIACFPTIMSESLTYTWCCLTCALCARLEPKNGHEKGRMVGPCLHCRRKRRTAGYEETYSTDFSWVQSPSAQSKGEKCANINMPLKERWLGVYRREILLTQGWSKSNSFSPLGSPLFISHMARPPVLLTQDGERCWENHTRAWVGEQWEIILSADSPHESEAILFWVIPFLQVRKSTKSSINWKQENNLT